MKSILSVGLLILVLAFAAGCKRTCYTCTQYCAYCALRADTSIIYKVCTSKYDDHLRIDSIENTFPDTTYICNILYNTKTVCDNKNHINDAITYYQQEDYFCTPQ